MRDLNDKMVSAVFKGNVKEVERLVNTEGVNINSKRNNSDKTPLMIAACWGYTEIVRFLLEKGANPNVQEKIWGRTALHFVFLEKPTNDNYATIIGLLAAYGANFTLKDYNGCIPQKAQDYGSYACYPRQDKRDKTHFFRPPPPNQKDLEEMELQADIQMEVGDTAPLLDNVSMK